MKRSGRMGVAGLLLGLVIAGCDLSDDSSANSDVSGTWLYTDTKAAQSTWALVQSGDGTLSGAGTDGEKVIGSVSGDDIHMSLTYAGSATASLNGTVTGNTMTGSFTNSVSGSGSWAAVRTN